MSSIRPVSTPLFVLLPTGLQIQVTKIGSVHLTSTLCIHNVFYIPSFRYNLLSVSKLSKESNCGILFMLNKCLFRDLTKMTLLAIGEEKGGLYEFHILVSSHSSVGLVVSVSATIDIETWHHRLGHASYNTLSKIACISNLESLHVLFLALSVHLLNSIDYLSHKVLVNLLVFLIYCIVIYGDHTKFLHIQVADIFLPWLMILVGLLGPS